MLGTSGKPTVGINAPSFDGTQPCIGIGTELFFPENNDEALELIKVVKPICDSCKFNAPCLDYALAHDEMGIWGGTTDLDRKRIKRRLSR